MKKIISVSLLTMAFVLVGCSSHNIPSEINSNSNETLATKHSNKCTKCKMGKFGKLGIEKLEGDVSK